MTRLTVVLSDSGDWPEAFVAELNDYHFLHFFSDRPVAGAASNFNWNNALRSATAQMMRNKHLMVTHDDECPEHKQDRTCNVCDGGLGMCVLCGGAEASLATDCPGYRIGRELEEEIMAGTKDFRNGWIATKPVWFGNHMKAVDASLDGRPRLAGYEITHVPAGFTMKHGCEWIAVPMPEESLEDQNADLINDLCYAKAVIRDCVAKDDPRLSPRARRMFFDEPPLVPQVEGNDVEVGSTDGARIEPPVPERDIFVDAKHFVVDVSEAPAEGIPLEEFLSLHEG